MIEFCNATTCLMNGKRTGDMVGPVFLPMAWFRCSRLQQLTRRTVLQPPASCGFKQKRSLLAWPVMLHNNFSTRSRASYDATQSTSHRPPSHGRDEVPTSDLAAQEVVAISVHLAGSHLSCCLHEEDIQPDGYVIKLGALHKYPQSWIQSVMG